MEYTRINRNMPEQGGMTGIMPNYTGIRHNEQECKVPEYTGTRRNDTRIRQNKPEEHQNEAD